MKNIFKKQNLMPVIVLGCICLVVAVLMGVVNMFTSPVIQKNEEQKVYESLKVVLDGYFDPIEKPENAPSTVTAIFRVTEEDQLIGHVITLEQKGYADKILMTVGVDKDNKITKVVITSQNESHGKNINPLLDRFASVSADQVSGVEHVSGATITSGYIKNAISDVFKTIDLINKNSDNNGGEEQDPYASLRELLDGTFETLELPEGAPSTVKALYKVTDGGNLVGHVVSLQQKGFEGDILLNVGIDNNGKITKVVITDQSESHGRDITPLLDGFVSVDKDGVDGVEHVSGATFTSGYIKDAVSDAFKVIGSNEEEKLPTSDEDLLVLASELVGEGSEFTNITTEGGTFVKRIFSENSGKGYVVYLVVMNERYGTVESETLVHVGKDKKIVNVKKLTWKTSDASDMYTPPVEETVDAFYATLAGKSLSDLEALLALENNDGQLVTGATSTSKNLVTSLVEALTAVSALRTEEIKDLASELVGGSNLTEMEITEAVYVKKLYKAYNGYIAHLVVINERYNRVETETLLHVGNDGKIITAKKLVWKTSDAGWGYEPPTDEVVDPFYARLVGFDLAGLENLLVKVENGEDTLVSNATSTSTALVNSIIEALTIINALPKDEIKDLASEIVLGAELTEVAVSEATYIKRIFDAGEAGYVVHLEVINERYNRTETETLVHISNDGKIVAVKKIVWQTSDAGWGYEPPAIELVDAFYATLAGKNLSDLEALLALETNDGQLVTGATSTSKAFVTSLVEAVTAVNVLAKGEIKNLASELAGGAELTELNLSNATYIKHLYKYANGYVAHLVVINERYNRVETETLVNVSNDGKIVAVNKLVWKTSDAGWGYEPPVIELVDAFYATLAGKNLSDLEALLALETNEGQLVTGATTTSKAFVTSLVEAVETVNALRAEEIKSLASELAGGAELSEVEVSDTTYLKALYKFADGYVAHLIVINERYNRVETETLVNISNDGKIVVVNKLVWKTSDAGWGYEPPAIELVDAFYATLAGKNLSDLEALLALETNDGQLVTGATSTSKAFVTSLVEALTVVNALPKDRIQDLASELVGGEKFVEIEVTDVSYIKRVFKMENNGYVVHLEVINERYSRTETETLVHISNDGKIVAVKKIVWQTSDAGWGYEPPAIELVDAFYATLAGKTLSDLEALLALETNDGQLVTGATTTSKAFVTSLVEAVKTVNALRAEEIKSLASELAGGAELTEVEVSDATYLKKLYKLSDGYIAHLIVINERYNRVETETLVHISNDGKIKDVKKLVWKTSDAGWGYEPPAIELVDAFYATLAGKNLSDLEALLALETNEGQLVTGATTTSKAFVTSLVEAVKTVNTLRAEEIKSLASELAGGAELTEVEVSDATYLKKLYKLSDGYIAHLIVINERYNRVETETLVYISNDGKIKDVKKLVWKTSDAGWGYEPPAIELVDAFYATLAGKKLSDLEALLALETNEGQLVSGATTTSKAFVTSLVEAVTVVNTIEASNAVEPTETNVPRIIGIVALSVMVIAMTTCIVVPKLNKGGKANEQ